MTRGDDIEALIPHRLPMRMIDRLIDAGDDWIVVGAMVRDTLFSTPEGLPAWVGIELMAQSVAVWAGLLARRQNRPVKLGFLLGTRRYTAHVPFFQFGANLHVHATCELVGENGLGVFACRILHGDRELATASLNVFQPPNVETYLNEGNT